MAFGLVNEMQKLEEALEAGGIAWWWLDLPSGAVFFSPNKAKMIDRDPSEFIHYSNFTDLLHPDDYDEAMKAMRDHMNGTAELYETQYRIKSADGSYKVFYDRGKIVDRKRNGDMSLAGMVLDITNFNIKPPKI